MLSLKDLGYMQNGIGSCQHCVTFDTMRGMKTFKGATHEILSVPDLVRQCMYTITNRLITRPLLPLV